MSSVCTLCDADELVQEVGAVLQGANRAFRCALQRPRGERPHEPGGHGHRVQPPHALGGLPDSGLPSGTADPRGCRYGCIGKLLRISARLYRRRSHDRSETRFLLKNIFRVKDSPRFEMSTTFVNHLAIFVNGSNTISNI